MVKFAGPQGATEWGKFAKTGGCSASLLTEIRFSDPKHELRALPLPCSFHVGDFPAKNASWGSWVGGLQKDHFDSKMSVVNSWESMNISPIMCFVCLQASGCLIMFNLDCQ